MSLDIGPLLENWDFEPGEITARTVRAADGREVLQLRIELGLLQMEIEGRPDGTRPHGFPTYFDYLQHEARICSGQRFAMSRKQRREADREFLQFYHRRLAWLALKEYGRAVADADHNLAFMDFVKEHSPSEEYTIAHEQYRGFVLFQRTQAAVAQALHEADLHASPALA